jgi:predicted ribosomally synthesized peptide with SipW-like signal peptide
MTNMDRKVLAAFLVVGLVATIAGGGLYAYFNDTETSTGNVFTAGTLDLKVNGTDTPVVHIEAGPIYPGWSKTYIWCLSNTGSLDGKLWLEVTNIVNNENGVTEPEQGAPGENGGEPGELGQYLMVSIFVYNPTTSGGSYWGFAGHWLNDLTNSWHVYQLSHVLPSTSQGLIKAGDDKAYVKMTFTLSTDVGNCVQGDSVSFDIVFHLDQA